MTGNSVTLVLNIDDARSTKALKRQLFYIDLIIVIILKKYSYIWKLAKIHLAMFCTNIILTGPFYKDLIFFDSIL